MLDYLKDRLPDKPMDLGGWVKLIEEGKLVNVRTTNLTVGIKG